jgi:prolyl-tRNA synthetase
MRASRFLISTLKEAPSEAEVISHKLMLRSGMVRRLAGGIYSWMPLGLRVVRKIEEIIRSEMNRAGAVELSMPVVQPAELWQESGRWKDYGAELLRFKDRHDREFVIQPTSEEVVTDIARSEIRSYRQLPLHLYQIQTKFRDERRPRFGVMRGREFIMKDGYSFHSNSADLRREYDVMHDTYTRIFTRLGLDFRAVAADTGSIGGTGSHEFHVLADSGEDAIAFSPASGYAANVELAEALAPSGARSQPTSNMQRIPTPGKKTCEQVVEQLGLPLSRSVKAIAVVSNTQDGPATTLSLLLVRGDHTLNEVKTSKIEGLGSFRFAMDAEIRSLMNCEPGYIGPVGVGSAVRVIADRSVAVMSDFVCGANEPGHHLSGVNWLRDLPEPVIVADIRNVVSGDPASDGSGPLEICRGIEVGHIFQLGTKYSRALKCTYLDAEGKQQFVEMGCYGIGVTRIVGAAIEQGHDERGIVLPDSIAPFRLAIIPIGMKKSEAVRGVAESLYAALLGSGIDVLLDDRDERPGVLLADSELMGIPHRIVIGERSIKQGIVEYQARTAATPTQIPLSEAARLIMEKLG